MGEGVVVEVGPGEYVEVAEGGPEKSCCYENWDAISVCRLSVTWFMCSLLRGGAGDTACLVW